MWIIKIIKIKFFYSPRILNKQKNTDASILVYKFRPERTGFNMYAEYTQPQLTFLALIPWKSPTFLWTHIVVNYTLITFWLKLFLFLAWIKKVWLPQSLVHKQKSLPLPLDNLQKSLKHKHQKDTRWMVTQLHQLHQQAEIQQFIK